jgi:hypothetical protein
MSEINKQSPVKDNAKRERFVRVVESRVNKILSNLDNLGKCSNKRNYEYSEEEVRKIFREIEHKVRETHLQFQSGVKNKGKFKL